MACLFIIWGTKKRTEEKRAEKNQSRLEKYTFLYHEKKHMKSGRTKITFYIPQRALGTFSPSFILRKKKSTQVFLHHSYLSDPASPVLLEIKGKQANYPTSCQVKSLLINMLSSELPRSADDNSPPTLGYKKEKNTSSVLSIINSSHNSSSF